MQVSPSSNDDNETRVQCIYLGTVSVIGAGAARYVAPWTPKAFRLSGTRALRSERCAIRCVTLKGIHLSKFREVDASVLAYNIAPVVLKNTWSRSMTLLVTS